MVKPENFDITEYESTYNWGKKPVSTGQFPISRRKLEFFACIPVIAGLAGTIWWQGQKVEDAGVKAVEAYFAPLGLYEENPTNLNDHEYHIQRKAHAAGSIVGNMILSREYSRELHRANTFKRQTQLIEDRLENNLYTNQPWDSAPRNPNVPLLTETSLSYLLSEEQEKAVKNEETRNFNTSY